jgi:nucleotide-binding universal stress UspA family protein
VIGLARDFGAHVTLYHAIPRPIEPVFQSGIYMVGTPWVPVQEYYSRMVERHHQHVGGWVSWAKNQGVEINSIVHTDTVDVAGAIHKIARDYDIGLIAMAAHNGPFAAALLGSVARQVVRSAECPVWVVRPETAVEAKPRQKGEKAA